MTLPIIEEVTNTIICGDCSKVIKGWPVGCVDLVLTDPPYGISGKGKIRQTSHGCVEAQFGEWDTYSLVWLESIRSKIKDTGAVTTFHDVKKSTEIWSGCKENNLHPRNYFVWHKRKGGLNPRRQFVNDFEIGVWATCGKQYTWNGGAVTKNVFVTEWCELKWPPNCYHPTQKTIAVMEWLVGLFSNPGDLIIDPFCGSGTTCVAAKMLGRNYIGIDISEEYCEIARQRLKAVGTGVPVNEQRAGQLALFGEKE